ncbi:hypothetical protein SAMN02745866_00634 [Alteromonadaceae bacterium Bs31]|nr:hypothetical protein SAMN02745866_00634 [Alteromonadaceae bacterium Bs31]
MMTENEYLWAWIYYVLGAGLLLACWWYLTRRIPWMELRHVLRLVMAVALLVPWYTNTQQEYMSPALLIALVEGLFDGSPAFWRAGTPLLSAVLAALVLSTIVFLVRWVILRRRSSHAATAS